MVLSFWATSLIGTSQRRRNEAKWHPKSDDSRERRTVVIAFHVDKTIVGGLKRSV